MELVAISGCHFLERLNQNWGEKSLRGLLQSLKPRCETGVHKERKKLKQLKILVKSNLDIVVDFGN